MRDKIKAVAMLSGGLDSIIAARLIMDQGIDVTCIYFSSPFWSSEDKEAGFIKEVEKQNEFKIMIVPVGDEYIDIVKNPEYGHGKGMNPCVDCKVFMLRKAKKIMEELGASFIITGEVVGQRPMSQHKSALNYIEKHADVKGILVRPLSAKLLPPTEPEKNGLIDRNKLTNIAGRSRKMQNEYAGKLNINKFSSPAGGCLLTQKVYTNKIKDLFDHEKNITMKEIELLNYGRHFRFKNSKIIAGRNLKENLILKKIKNADDYVFEVEKYGSPVTLLQGEKTEEAVNLSASLTLLYSDSPKNENTVRFEKDGKVTNIEAERGLTKDDIMKYNLSNC